MVGRNYLVCNILLLRFWMGFLGVPWRTEAPAPNPQALSLKAYVRPAHYNLHPKPYKFISPEPYILNPATDAASSIHPKAHQYTTILKTYLDPPMQFLFGFGMAFFVSIVIKTAKTVLYWRV